MNNLLRQKWCLCLNVQNRIKLCRAKNRKFGDDTTVYRYIFTKKFSCMGRGDLTSLFSSKVVKY